jgi:hypothetical protein
LTINQKSYSNSFLKHQNQNISGGVTAQSRAVKMWVEEMVMSPLTLAL